MLLVIKGLLSKGRFSLISYGGDLGGFFMLFWALVYKWVEQNLCVGYRRLEQNHSDGTVFGRKSSFVIQ